MHRIFLTLSALLYIVSGEPHISPSGESCPSGWIKFDQHCYLFRDTYNDRMTWKSAKSVCQRQGANLLSITSKEEQDFISHHFSDKRRGQVWLGLNDRKVEGHYTWSDGSPVTFLNWHPGEPNDVNNVENCAEMYPRDTQWKDVKCTDFNGYICKQPLEHAHRPITPNVRDKPQKEDKYSERLTRASKVLIGVSIFVGVSLGVTVTCVCRIYCCHRGRD